MEKEKAWDRLLGLMFVAEYFGHSESYLLTKAMILYHAPRSRYALESYSIRDRMEMLRILYDFQISAVSVYISLPASRSSVETTSEIGNICAFSFPSHGK